MNQYHPLRLLSSRLAFSLLGTTLYYALYAHIGQSGFSLGGQFELIGKTYALKDFFPELWHFLSVSYPYIKTIAAFILFWRFYTLFLSRLFEKDEEDLIEEADIKHAHFPWSSDELQLIIGLKHQQLSAKYVRNPEWIVVPESGIFQNFLITGTTGTGKTASVMYPLTKQILLYGANDPSKKAGMLILDVKGNYYQQVLAYAKECGREKDVILISMDSECDTYYNPVYKPGMEPIDLAKRSQAVMELNSRGVSKGGDSQFWDGKAMLMMAECIRLLNGAKQYFTLADIHKVLSNEMYLREMLDKYDIEFDKGNITQFNHDQTKTYFHGEFQGGRDGGATRVAETIKSCLQLITGFFVSSEKINEKFCPPKRKLNFTGFSEVINEGKIVVMGINVFEYPQVAQTIAAFLKSDFEQEVLKRTASSNLNRTRPVFLICDEAQNFVTSEEAAFCGVSRESRCCTILATQSYSSLQMALGNQSASNTLQQNLVNKIWLRSDDEATIKLAQMLTGRVEKERYSSNISESASNAQQSSLTGLIQGQQTSLSESRNISTQRENLFEEVDFTQNLKMFMGITFLAGNNGMQQPTYVHLLPHFKPPISEIRVVPSPKSDQQPRPTKIKLLKRSEQS